MLIMSFLIFSLPSERDNRLSAFNPEMRSKTDNLERLISEVERQGDHSDQGGSTNSLGNREVKKYIRCNLYLVRYYSLSILSSLNMFDTLLISINEKFVAKFTEEEVG